MSGMLVAIEGIDASGKDTQARMLAERLRKEGVSPALFSFPNYDTPTGQLIKGFLRGDWKVLHKEGAFASFPESRGRLMATDGALVLQSLMVANRMEKVNNINHCLSMGDVVIADRWTESGTVYAYADGIPMETIVRLLSALPKADLQILLDIDVEESFRRRPKREDSYYEEDKHKLANVAHLYRALWYRMGEKDDRWVILDGTRSPEDLHNEIVSLVRKHRPDNA